MKHLHKAEFTQKYLPFCDWLISLSMTTSKFSYVVASFLRLNTIPHVSTTISLSVHLSVDIQGVSRMAFSLMPTKLAWFVCQGS